MLTPAERGQTLLLVALATAAELTFSLVLDWYAYRLGNVPPWIPPAHGIVFVTALLWSKDPLALRRQTAVRLTATVLAVTYGVLALVLAEDVGGALGVGLLLVWLWAVGAERGRFYAMMWLVVCYLEACGVLIGTWAWAPTVPLIGVSEANPPSGIVGVYGFFDLIALAVVSRYFTRRPGKLANAQPCRGNVEERGAVSTLVFHSRPGFDALTELPDRPAFLAGLRSAIHTGEGMAVLFLDLDDFKLVNDGFGHEAGDRLLIQVAHRSEGHGARRRPRRPHRRRRVHRAVRGCRPGARR